MDVMHCAPLVAATASVPPRPAGIILILMLMPRPALLCLARQVEALASYDNGGKVVVCDPTCDDGTGNSSHCNCECILPASVILGTLSFLHVCTVDGQAPLFLDGSHNIAVIMSRVATVPHRAHTFADESSRFPFSLGLVPHVTVAFRFSFFLTLLPPTPPISPFFPTSYRLRARNAVPWVRDLQRVRTLPLRHRTQQPPPHPRARSRPSPRGFVGLG